MTQDPNPLPAARKKPRASTLLFVLAGVFVLGASFEFATGRSLPGRRWSRSRAVNTEHSYNMLFIGGAVLVAACFRRAWESR